MAWATPPTKIAGNVILSADWNQYIRDNWASIAGAICYYNGSSAPSGWTEYTTARGLFILGLVSGGTLATAVGTPLTNQQNITHTHTVNGSGWGSAGTEQAGQLLTGSRAGGQGNATDTAAQTTSAASAGSIGMPYIQLLCIQKSA